MGSLASHLGSKFSKVHVTCPGTFAIELYIIYHIREILWIPTFENSPKLRLACVACHPGSRKSNLGDEEPTNSLSPTSVGTASGVLSRNATSSPAGSGRAMCEVCEAGKYAAKTASRH